MSVRIDVEVAAGAFSLAVALDADPGDTVVVVGPNGAGKTTLLRAVAGLAGGARGSIRVGDEVWLDGASGVASDRRSVGMVFAGGALFPHLSALENVAFGLEARGAPRRDARAAALTWLERMGVAPSAGLLPAQLSSGQARRVALARALVVEPALLLLDEPLTSLDLDTVAAVRRDLAAHLEAFAGVTLMVSHDPVDAGVLATRVAVLEDGRLTQLGTPEEVTARPRSRYAARWVGVNLLRGSATGGVVALEGGASLTVADAPDGRVLVAVHPASVSLHAEQPGGSPRNVWRATVAAVDEEGSRRRVQLEGPVPLVAEVTGAGLDALELAPGAAVWAAVKATEIEVYPA